MTDTFTGAGPQDTPLEGTGKKPYHSPTLVLFGQVGQLTQGGSTCGDNDSSTCTVGAATMGPMATGSDRSIKENLVRIGTHPLGVGLYLFDYKPPYRAEGQNRQFGVMADEVEAVMPEAVGRHPDGYKVVDYGMLGIKRPPN